MTKPHAGDLVIYREAGAEHLMHLALVQAVVALGGQPLLQVRDLSTPLGEFRTITEERVECVYRAAREC